MRDPVFTVVGAGLAGTLMSCYLARAGHRVDLYERRADPRTAPVPSGEGHGRSINLALSVRGIHALQEVGLAEEVLRNGILMRGRMMHSATATLTFQPYGKDDSEALYSVSRGGLNHMLVESAARHESVRLFFDHKCLSYELGNGNVEFQRGDGVAHLATDIVIAADGAYSAVRASLQKQERFDYAQEYLDHGYKELTIPAGPAGSHRLEKHALHIWPRGQFMMIALPNLDGSFTCTLFWPFDGPNSFAVLKTEGAIRAFFEQQFPDAAPLMPNLMDEFLHNPVGSLVTVRCKPWHQGGKAVLIGDACHAVVPFLGQGMNAAFEDCAVLSRCLLAHGPDWQLAFQSYEAQRKPHLDVLADLCVANFIEMRDRVGSKLFIMKKRLEVGLHRLFPSWYLPLYTMVEFTRIPYADALRRARRQDWIVRGVLLLLSLLLAALAWLGR